MQVLRFLNQFILSRQYFDFISLYELNLLLLATFLYSSCLLLFAFGLQMAINVIKLVSSRFLQASYSICLLITFCSSQHDSTQCQSFRILDACFNLVNSLRVFAYHANSFRYQAIWFVSMSLKNLTRKLILDQFPKVWQNLYNNEPIQQQK